MGTSSRKRSNGRLLWSVMALLVVVSIPLAFYEPSGKSFILHIPGVVGAIVSIACVVGLLREKRWALWVTAARFILGLIVSALHIQEMVEQSAGGWATLAKDAAERPDGPSAPLYHYGIAVLIFLAVASIASVAIALKLVKPTMPSFEDDAA